uniref:Uncharacterized protein n=1 Tax=Sphaerodactylus townsendi TaxID=933632 RepID=A0ACB8EH31_9SAUR
MKFKSCNTDPCSKQKKDFRDEQCAVFDGKHFNINGLPPNVRWVPKYSGILMKDRCKLFCRVAGNTAYYQLRDRVIDGTPCGPDTNDICVQGLCRPLTCHNKAPMRGEEEFICRVNVMSGQGAEASILRKLDVIMCSIPKLEEINAAYAVVTIRHAERFKGRSIQCTMVITLWYTFQLVLRILMYGSIVTQGNRKMITILLRFGMKHNTEPDAGQTSSNAALRALSGSDGFILNGDYVVSMFKKEIRVGNAVIEYSGSDSHIERINSTYRIDQEIVLQVLSVGNLYNPDVRYTFNIPIEDKPQQFYWNIYGPWQPCSKVCQAFDITQVLRFPRVVAME